MVVLVRCTVVQVLTEVNNRVQRLLLNYITALFRTGDFPIVYYQTGELEYIPHKLPQYVESQFTWTKFTGIIVCLLLVYTFGGMR